MAPDASMPSQDASPRCVLFERMDTLRLETISPQRLLDRRTCPARILGGRGAYRLEDDQRALIFQPWQAERALLHKAPAERGGGAFALLHFRADQIGRASCRERV